MNLFHYYKQRKEQKEARKKLLIFFEKKYEEHTLNTVRHNHHLRGTGYSGLAVKNGLNYAYGYFMTNKENFAVKYRLPVSSVRKLINKAHYNVEAKLKNDKRIYSNDWI